MTLTTYLRKCLISIICCLSFGATVSSQGVPFNCDYSAYLFQYNDVYAIDLASGNSFMVAENITDGNINAAAYNPADGYIWGYLSSPSKSIVRIGKDFKTTTFTIDALTTGNKYIGAINANGKYFFKAGGTTYHVVDLDSNSSRFTELLETTRLSKDINIHDWAFNAVDNNLYAVEKKTNILYRINPANGEVLSLGEVPALAGLNYTFGAVYFDASGRFYVSANQTGTIYVIQSVQNLNGTNAITSGLFAFGPASSLNDGARCPTAPVPQEICDNGIDDDGDGLIDCEDPSCSKYGSCDEVTPEASSGNNGGLESNNRLSDVIAKRNYKRVKTNYSFERKLAPKFKKSAYYAQKRPGSSFVLQDFIPINEINEDYVIESTPSDLIGITNASEVYSVDYIKNESSQASILALKSENGVYEHTKYICDRLLGAELLSVSTIEVNDQQFIKSLIKNTDGSTEFVVSLSAKMINNETEFSIESHWNLDKYENNATFYNFQIWANTIDDLYHLVQEVLNLLDTQRTITEYILSTPPTVFVRKGKYLNGALDLKIVNTNSTESIVFDAGIRATETKAIETMNTTIDLNGNYITDITIPTGFLFDTGFRIGDGIATPDDLFLSDGPWGLDAPAENVSIESFEITENTNDFDEDSHPVERNIHLKAQTSNYIAAYRALTPRFQPVDLHAFEALQLMAKGTGELEITLVKASIADWEKQYKTTITLTDTFNKFNLPLEEFSSSNGASLMLDDLVTIVFKMTTGSAISTMKEMTLKDIQFTTAAVVETEAAPVEILKSLINYPNPFSSSTTIQLTQLSKTVQITVVDMLGRVVDKQHLTSQDGNLKVNYTAPNLQTGIYTYRITDNKAQQFNGKFVIKR